MFTIGMSPIREGSLDWPDLGLVCVFAMLFHGKNGIGTGSLRSG